MKTARQLDREIARADLTRRIQKLLTKWQAILGVRIDEFHIKKMNAWATLNPEDRRLWVSEKLATMSDAALEYVVVHELMHMLIDEGPEGSGHDERFYALMDRYLPRWRDRHASLRSDGIVAAKLPRMR